MSTGQEKADKQKKRVDPSVWGPVATVVALIASLLILQGQTNSRIDSVRSELSGDIDNLRKELGDDIAGLRTELAGKMDATDERINATNERINATNERIDATNERIDRVLEALTGIGSVADDIEALRADVAKLVNQ